MDNFLDNGTVLPSGLMSVGEQSAMEGFNKTYRNTQLRMGIIVRSYAASNPNNLLNLTTEYDVLVFEQNEDKGSTVITYKNCMAAEGSGSIADFFEKNLRVRENNSNTSVLIDTKNQNGAIALLLCLDGMSDKAIILGAMTHPDRATTLLTEEPYLQGEYNGANVTVNNDGSAVFTFNGATDNEGNPIDSTQGPTVIQVEKDGSFQVNHSTITFRLDRNGNATLTANGDINITANGNTTIEGTMVNLGANATDAVIKGNSFKEYFDTHTHPTAVGPSGPPVSPMPPSTLSEKVVTE